VLTLITSPGQHGAWHPAARLKSSKLTIRACPPVE
jgi:hypothetical protein